MTRRNDTLYPVFCDYVQICDRHSNLEQYHLDKQKISMVYKLLS